MSEQRQDPSVIIGRYMDNFGAAQREEAEKVVVQASRVINALQEVEGGSTAPEDAFRAAPPEIPLLAWKKILPGLSEADAMQIIGTIGEYYNVHFPDQKPSAIFNAGFYAGVLAAKMALVQAEAFGTMAARQVSDPISGA